MIMNFLEIFWYCLIIGLNLSVGIKCLVDYCKATTSKAYASNLALATLNLGAVLLVLFVSLIPAAT